MLEEILRTGKTGRKWYPKAQKYYDYLLPAGSCATGGTGRQGVVC